MGLRQFPAHTNIWWVWGIAFLLIVICLRLRRSFFGRALIAIGQDQDMAEHARVDNLQCIQKDKDTTLLTDNRNE